MAKLEIYMLGHLKILLDGEPIADSLSHKAAAILCYLAFQKGKSVSREKLSSLFWDSSSLDAARYNLRYNLWSLRKILKDVKKEPEYILIYKDACKMNMHGDIYIDILEMEELLDELRERDPQKYIQSLEKAKLLYKGDFLEGFYLKKCPEWNDWIFYERERFQRKYFELLYQLMNLYKTEGMYFKGIEVLEEMLQMNPLQEELYVELMKLYLALGDRNAALNQYRRCCNVLREELNVGPMESTKKMYQEIQAYNNVHEHPFSIKHKEHFKHKHPKIIYADEKRIHLLEQKWKKRHSCTILFTDCYPLEDLPYYWISNLVEEMIHQLDHSLLKNLSFRFWEDIFRIANSVTQIFGEIYTKDHLTEITEKNRIYSALAKLLHTIAGKQPLCIVISEFQWMDQISFEFLKYFLFKNKDTKITFVLTGERDDFRIKEIKKYFAVEEG